MSINTNILQIEENEDNLTIIPPIIYNNKDFNWDDFEPITHEEYNKLLNKGSVPIFPQIHYENKRKDIEYYIIDKIKDKDKYYVVMPDPFRQYYLKSDDKYKKYIILFKDIFTIHNIYETLKRIGFNEKDYLTRQQFNDLIKNNKSVFIISKNRIIKKGIQKIMKETKNNNDEKGIEAMIKLYNENLIKAMKKCAKIKIENKNQKE